MKKLKSTLLALVALVCCFSMLSSSVILFAEETKEKRIVRVGYLENYATIADVPSEGKMGYGHEYLSEISKYTNWEYKFVLCSWDEGLQKLKDGEIDIFGPMQKTEERQKIYDFPVREMGFEHGTLYVSENSDIFYDDYEKFDNMRVASLKDNYFLPFIDSYAAKNGITLTSVITDSTAYAKDLKSGLYDMFLLSNISADKGLKPVAKVATSPFYYATTKGNTEILNGLNESLESIFANDLQFASKLEKKYYSANFAAELGMTRQENEYIKTHKVLKVAVDSDFSPISSYNFETKEYTGICVDILKELGKSFNVEFEFVESNGLDNKLSHLESGQADLIMSDCIPFDSELKQSNSILNIPIILLGNSCVDVSKELTVAIPNFSSNATIAMMEAYPNYRYVNYHSFSEIKNAVKNKKVDLGFLGSYMADDIAREDNFSDYLTIPTDITYPINIGVLPTADATIIGLINKSVQKLSNERVNSIIFENTVNRVYHASFFKIIEENTLLVITVIFLIFALMLLFIYVNTRNTRVKLQKAAYIDHLTGLYTKEKFRIEAEAKLKNATPGEYCIYSIDINNFKYINDAFGYTVGNHVLQSISDHLREHSDLYIIASRMQADTFILFAKAPPEDSIIQAINQLHDADNHIATVLPSHYHVTFSTGVYIIDKPAISLDAMIDKAGTARKSIKGGYQSSVSIYTNEIEEIIDRQKDITLAMEHALYNNEFLVYLQPKFDLHTNLLVGAEALVRWENPARGFMMPNDFISLFEKNGFIIKLDLYMFKQVSLTLRNIMNRYNAKNQTTDDDFGMIFSVNLSKFSLTDPFIVEKICEILEQSQVPTRLIEIELTESLVTDDLENLLKIMERFKAKGFAVSIDDFGSGYSSLNLLKDLPIQIIKIDRAFLSQTSDTYRGQTIISSILRMAKLLGICTVAEGVENEDQVQLLRSMGCDVAQGYYYSKPLPKDEFIDKFVFPQNDALSNAETI